MIYDKILHWAAEKGILDKGNAQTQLIKLVEEQGELAEAILKDNKEEVKDAVGDMIIVLTNLCYFYDLKVEDCVISAYNEIKNRKGKIINKTFVKDESSK
jgi:NTP pyrophosphatase (non-canonical NTP hydrolase)